MELSKDNINKLLNMNDSDLAEKLSKAIDTLGLDKSLESKFLSNKKEIKKALSNISESDLNMLSAIIKSGDTEALNKLIKNEKWGYNG